MDRKPFLLKPAAKDYLWGGSRLNDDFSKNIDMRRWRRHGNARHIRMDQVLLQVVSLREWNLQNF